jgi:hypothetical protein
MLYESIVIVLLELPSNTTSDSSKLSITVKAFGTFKTSTEISFASSLVTTVVFVVSVVVPFYSTFFTSKFNLPYI